MQNTHKKIEKRYSGKVVKQEQIYAKVILYTNIDMVADEKGLIHGGFTFSGADFCAMIAINEPNVVLTGANVTFIAPVKLGDVIEFEGIVVLQNGAKGKVKVVGRVNDKIVFKGDFKTYVTKNHILERK